MTLLLDKTCKIVPKNGRVGVKLSPVKWCSGNRAGEWFLFFFKFTTQLIFKGLELIGATNDWRIEAQSSIDDDTLDQLLWFVATCLILMHTGWKDLKKRWLRK